jgi:hypothetical protein
MPGLRILAAALCCAACITARAECPPADSTAASLRALKAQDWKVADDAKRQALALAIADCLEDPNPELRDDLAFDALSHWMRAGQLDTTTLQALRVRMLARLRAEPDDAAGVRRPFAVLTLAEVARADRIQPYLSVEQRAELVQAATRYLTSVRDYRGYDPSDGWRHGVAHGADFVLQLVLNPAVTRAHLESMLAAIASQVMPEGHFYIYGESDRLVTPVFFIGRRKIMTADEWGAWFGRLAAQRKRTTPMQAALAANHNLEAFLLPLYATLKQSNDSELQALMLPGVLEAMKAVD